ncbi:hypothetical protein [Haladaptatus sp.]|uniref:hypothetical protein n=1 Tax=Haladaptatus sp. TaxID=1973141 RepID=UPI003C69F59D
MVRTVSDWFPDRPPTWGEILPTTLISFSLAADPSVFDTISWAWVAVGFVLTGIGLGPARATALGKRFGQWFRDIGVTGRISAIILFFVVAWGTLLTVEIPIAVIDSFVVGMWAALILYFLAHIAHAGEISGWRAR